MSRCRRVALSAAILGGVLPAAAATAADDQGQFGIRGAGLVPCAVFEREREARSEAYHMVAGWMDGYITGANQYRDETFDVTSFESTELIVAMVSEHCKAHPEAIVFGVVNALVKQFADNRLLSPSDKIEIAVSERRTLLYEETVRRLQERLTATGLYDAGIDGVYDSEVQSAMEAFQAAIGLTPTGFPDQLSLWRLFNEDSRQASRGAGHREPGAAE